MFMLQEVEQQNTTATAVVSKKGLQVEHLKQKSHQIKFQPDEIVQHITSRLKYQQIGWDNFANNAKYLIPKTLNDKMLLFLRSISP